MRKVMASFLIFVFCTSFGGCTGANAKQSNSELKSFIENIYSHRPTVFEQKKISGKHNPSDHCKLMHEFFSEEILIHDNKNSCKPKSGNSDVPFRFPGLQYGDLGEDGTLGSAYPVAAIEYIKLNDNFASIALTFSRSDAKSKTIDSFGRSILFARKLDGNWKVFNALLYQENWGSKKPAHCSDVKYTFLVRPIAERQLEDLPKDCLKQELYNMENPRYKY